MGKKLHRKEETGRRVLLIQGILPLRNIANCLTRAGFQVASIPNRPETLMTLGMFKSDVVVINDTVVNSMEAYYQTRSILCTPIMLLSGHSIIDTLAINLCERGAIKLRGRHSADELLVARVRATLTACLDTPGDSTATRIVKGKKNTRK